MQRQKWIFSLLTIAAVTIAGMVGLQIWAQTQAKSGVDAMVERIDPVAKVEYKSISANPWTGMVHLHSVSLRPAQSLLLPLYIKDLGINIKKNRENHLTHLKLNIHGLDLPVGYADAYPLVRQILHQHGQAILQGDVFADYQYHPTKAQMSLLLYTQFAGLGKLEINLVAQPYTPDAMRPTLFSSLALRKLELIYQDQSLMQKLWSVLGAQDGHSSAEYQEQLIHELNKSIEQSAVPTVKSSLTALREFVERPKYLRIHLITVQPTSLQQLQSLSPDEARQSMEIRITSKQR